jgi:hypothetical protein
MSSAGHCRKMASGTWHGHRAVLRTCTTVQPRTQYASLLASYYAMSIGVAHFLAPERSQGLVVCCPYAVSYMHASTALHVLHTCRVMNKQEPLSHHVTSSYATLAIYVPFRCMHCIFDWGQLILDCMQMPLLPPPSLQRCPAPQEAKAAVVNSIVSVCPPHLITVCPPQLPSAARVLWFAAHMQLTADACPLVRSRK